MTTDSQHKLRSAFFDEAEILFILYNKNLVCVDVNKAFVNTLNLKKENLIGKHVTEFIPDAETSGRLELFKKVFGDGKPIIIDEVKPHPSLGNLYLRMKAFKVGNNLGVTIKNITDLKETIDELETFIHKASHDMRGPIASILGITNLANTQVKNLDEAKHFCKIVQQQTQRLDSILLVLMETLRIRKGEKTIHLIDFNKLIEEVLNSLEFMKGFSEIKFIKNISISQKFYSDKLLLNSLFQNLIDNAIKYTRNIPDAFIKISVAEENGGVKITVADNGIGIPDNLQKDVFKLFFRATNEANGHGLGLYTTSHTIKKLGGTIKLDSKEKVGTTFTVYLPNENINGQTK